MNEPSILANQPSTWVGSTDKPEVVFQGVAASPGVVYGLPYLFFHKDLEIPIYSVEKHLYGKEAFRFEQALIKTRMQIYRLRMEIAERLGEEEAKIFDAHLLVLEDKALIDETILEQNQYGYNIEYCFHYVAKRYIDAFNHIDDLYIKERVTDIRDVTRRVLQNLLGQSGAGAISIAEPKILISEDITPSDTASLDRQNVLGIVTDVGSRTSHAVIMARSLKVPAVVGLHDISLKVQKDDALLVDGYDGIVIVNPSEETLYRYGKLKVQKESIGRIFESALSLPTATVDGVCISLLANIEGTQDIPAVLAANFEGVGLFRTEALMMQKERFPSEEEQFLVYKEIAESIPFPIVIRTLDLGGDKKISSSFLYENETNPFMGFRAIRFCLEHKTVFKEQLKAILRASAYGKMSIMYPMISSALEVERANAFLEEIKNELTQEKKDFDPNIRVGCMIEIPSAAFSIDLLAQNASFFSVGTNDLIQYMLAVDRSNDRIAHLYEPHNPAIIRILHKIIKDCQHLNVPVSICGEMAADPIYIPLLIGLGAMRLSIAPSACAEIKYFIRSIHSKEAKSIARKALKEKSPHKILKLLQDFYNKKTSTLTLLDV